MRIIKYVIFLFICYQSAAQIEKNVIAGPVLGTVELRSAQVWVEVAPEVKSLAVVVNKKGAFANKAKKIIYRGVLGKEFNPCKFLIGGLEVNTTYTYHFEINNKPSPFSGEFTTKELWQWRKNAPDFSFLTGSCAYFNEPQFDRPGKPYGNDSSIFETMAKTPAAFMLWLGDNWYYRDVDYYDEWGLNYRASRDRSLPCLQPFWKAMPHYAIWDDHDYGNNDADKSYILKEKSREIFKNYWMNPSYGMNEQGVFTKITYNDVDFFLLDNRWYRSNDEMKDSIDGKPNPEKLMWGKEQMDWLKNALLRSNVESKEIKPAFRIIVTGSQVLNPYSPFDCARFFPAEYYELLSFIRENKIEGVVFLTGDRHHSEIIKMNREGTYPLFDVTVSSLTAGVGIARGLEKDNPARIPNTLIEENNFAKISISGKKSNRVLTVEFYKKDGKKLTEWSVNENELK
ncbi:MAG TPA: alkaline phosphatase D family protein [Chitinophagaceae bacterium]|nr:alkaline phosphatase D family protein [Chitinophagaceae bacterium]